MTRTGLDRSTLVIAGVATLGLVMAVLDTTIVNVALDSLSRDLHAFLATIQWVSTGYLLSLAAVIPLSGWLTERFGSKRTWIASIVLFASGSALCALATWAGELGLDVDQVQVEIGDSDLPPAPYSGGSGGDVAERRHPGRCGQAGAGVPASRGRRRVLAAAGQEPG